ncbi:Zn-ribbon domain-containing OB-fold protein [Bradyrhizobium sp. 150]|uniref:Zn-ribbon domain-containing OB-fold protein n=1 Tax=Bradyrhizobium sp. 150 TaxID=2782625 RepID=UPI001FF7F247|nr:Zn-ribbon domain-containing OB-fold protein [Bradyrhizobium sp. 150]MCK1675185.1 Zn-ribbon domain-containing OB-fold protein [Bradyrhizobium sp. 150]
MDKGKRYVPVATPETKHFWDGASQGRLVVQQCQQCEHTYFPPRPFCCECGSRDVAPRECSGRARLYSYVISHRAAPGFEAPYSIAVVELEEGPRLMTNIVNVPQTPEALVLDMPLRVTFKELSTEITLPLFEPQGAAS